MPNKRKLELTWIGKENRPKLEPRILLEDPAKSYHAAQRVSDADSFDNRLIFGDNLLALKALEAGFTGEVKCVYIDPPFNTGDMLENYDDGLEHSIWLGQMRERLCSLWRLLNPSGSIFVHLNDDELDYCKVVLDEIFDRSNFVNRITISARSPSAFSTVNPGVFKSAEYILWYAKRRDVFKENRVRVVRPPDNAYNKWLVNPDARYQEWRFTSLLDVYSKEPPPRSKRPEAVVEQFHKFVISNASRICRLASISDSGAGEAIVALKSESLESPGIVHCLRRQDEGLDDVYVLDGQQVLFYAKNVLEVDGELAATSFMTNIWSDIAWEGIAKEGGVTFRKGKKPERLIKRCLELATSRGDLVLDSFAGSGTTGAVAQKMGRRWIMVELGEHCHTHIIPRLKKVIDGEDPGGITKAVNWKGGGGFRYYRLAPSLLEKDKWGNWVINREYNAAMLAEALCKLEGFTYAPSDTVYWQQGHSTERDFIYVTTASLTHAQLQQLNDEVGSGRTLLVLCTAFRAKAGAYENLTVKKIPRQVLARCEWSHDDYSLQVENLPQAPVAPGQPSLFSDEDDA